MCLKAILSRGMLILVVLLISCKSVNTGTSDTIKTELNLVVHQNISGFRSAMVSSIENIDKTFDASSERDFYFTAGAIDSESGPNRLTVKVIRGGKIKVLESGGVERLVTEFTVTNIEEDGKTKDKLISLGSCFFDNEQNSMFIQAETVDFAGNITISPIVTVNPKKEPKIVKIESSIERSTALDIARIEFETLYTDIISVYSPFDGTPLTSNNMNDNVSFRISEGGVFKLVASNSVATISETINVRYSRPGAPVIERFRAIPSRIYEGESSVIDFIVDCNAPCLTEISGPRGENHQFRTTSGSLRVTPTGSFEYFLRSSTAGQTSTANVLITVSPRPTPPPPCWTTPNRNIIGAGFTYNSRLNGLYNWNMDLSDYISDGRTIKGIINKNRITVRLWTGGTAYDISPGGRLTGFDGITVNRGWTLEAAERIGIPAIEFCFE